MPKGVVRILVSRHSAFYSPVIAAVAAGFLEDAGLRPAYGGVLPKGRAATEILRAGEAEVVQAAVSSSWGAMERGEANLPVHFAQINQRDGFFLAGRRPEPGFTWKDLEGRTLLADHGGQPLYMLKYALRCQGTDWSRIHVVDAGSIEQIEATFRAGRGDYVHQQGPQPQELEKEGIAHVLACVGEAMPPVAFSSLMAMPSFLDSAEARAFTRGYRRARAWVQGAAAEEVTSREAAFFPGIDREALTAAIRRYQRLGCWLGNIDITRDLYEQALEVFLSTGAVRQRHPYEAVVVPPPE
jgi:NitT/TauT family transport system substrate-binding protein